MDRIIFRIILLNLFLLSGLGLLAGDLKHSDKDNWKTAEELLSDNDFDKALVIYEELFKNDPQNYNLAFKIGYCYVGGESVQDVSAAIDFLKMACENVGDKYKNTLKEKEAPIYSWYYLGVAYRLNREFDKAIDAFKVYEGLMTKQERKSLRGTFIDREIQSCHDAKTGIDSDRIKVEEIYIKDLEDPNVRCPILCFDADRLIFTNGKYNMFPPDINWDINYSEGPFDGVYTAIKAPDGTFYSPEAITKDLMIPFPNIPVTATGDGSELYIIVDRNDNGDIYMSKFVNGKYQKAEKVKALNSRKWESHATITADGKRMYFTSLRKGGEGGLDIWYSDRDEEGKWQKPINLGPEINTPFHEEMPYVIRNGNALYFSSEGHTNVGGFDVFYSSYNSESKTWSKPENLGYPFSTAGNDMGYIIENSPVFAFCPLNDNKRREGVGECDCISLLDEEAPQLASISGIVELDPDNEELMMQIKMKLIDKTTGLEVSVVDLDEDGNYIFEGVKTGSYEIVAFISDKDLMTLPVDVPLNENWNITGQNMKIFVEDIITLNDYVTDTVTGTTEVKPIVIENVFFDFDKYEIKPEYKENLDVLADYLKKYPTAVIKLTGHTDHYGTESYNLVLGENRAKAVRNYLLNKGVKNSQIVIYSAGEKENITIPVDDDRIRRLNRRVMIDVDKQGAAPIKVVPVDVPTGYRPEDASELS